MIVAQLATHAAAHHAARTRRRTPDGAIHPVARHPAPDHHDRRRRRAAGARLAGAQAAARPVSTIATVIISGGAVGRRPLAVGRRAAARGAHLREAGRGDGRLQCADHHADRHRHAAERAGGRRLPATRGDRRSGVPRAGHGVGLRRHVDGHGQRPHHRLPRPRDPLHRPLRADRLQLQAGGIGRGGPQVLHPRRVLLGDLHLRDRAHLRGDRLDQSHPDRRLPLQERRADQRPALGRAGPHAGRLRLQGGGGAVPHVDARRVPGGTLARHRLHGRRGQGRRVRRHAAGALLLLRRRRDRLAADRLRLGGALAGARCLRGTAPART